MATTYFVAWWNVENLFDYERSPRRTDKVRRSLGRALDGWTPQLRDQKIDRLATLIASLNGGSGPDLLGVCEVENEWVVRRLANRIGSLLPSRSYAVAHADTSDQRGIDVAFLYETTLLTAPPDQVFHHVVMRRTATRELFQVNFQTHRGRTWTVFGNHWPSRSGGPPSESAGYRAIAGETLAYFHQRVLQVHGPTTPVLVMGDFNDEPFDESVTKYALGTTQRVKVTKATSPKLWNLMWPVLGRGGATYFYEGTANVLDQILVNKHMAKSTSPIRVLADTVTVVNDHPGQVDPAATYPAPVRFGGIGRAVNPNGFSDHFPLTVQVTEAD